MTEKKKRKKTRPKQSQTMTTRDRSEALPLPDMRAMERAFQEIARALEDKEFASDDELNAYLREMRASGGPPARKKRTVIEEAQDVMYDAWEAEGKKRIKLAREALSISEDCADAYVLLAEESAKSVEEARELYEQGVRAGERTLPANAFEQDVGHFWGLIETRPYMRARLGLAQCLWSLGNRREAIEHLTDMLRLNPNDNQGVRWLLVNYLLEEGEDDALGDLLKRYRDEVSAVWSYSRALWTFRTAGPRKKATTALRKALQANSFVPSYLLGLTDLPEQPPPFMGMGDEDEAAIYAAQAMPSWDATEGALQWLFGIWQESESPERALLRKQLIKAVQHQVRANDPPEARVTLRRLQDAGHSRQESMGLLASALAEEMWCIMREERPFDPAHYKELLDNLA